MQILYINGPSSSGKTTLGRAIQEVRHEPFMLFGVDEMIEMMPQKLNDWSEGIDRLRRTDNPPGFSWHATFDTEGNRLHELVCGSFVPTFNFLYHEIVLTMARNQTFVIVDDVAMPPQVEQWRHLLGDFKVLYIGVTASVDDLDMRERKRGDRAHGSARAQLAKVHQGVTYDVFLNSSELSIEEMVQRVVEKI